MLRDWTNSDKINGLSLQAERFFVRLIMKVDDYGCFYADERLLRANLFPLLLDTIREADIPRWTAECRKAGLIVLYECNGKKYLQINDFRQRLDKAKSKFPQPPVNELPEVVNDFPAEVEVEKEVEEKKKNTALSRSFKQFSEEEFYADVAKFAEQFPKEMLRKFFEYWKEPSATGRMKFQLQKTWDTKLRLKNWSERQLDYKPKKQIFEPTGSAPLKKVIPNAIH